MSVNDRLLFDKYLPPYFAAGARVLEIGAESDPSWLQAMVEVPVTWETAELRGAVDAQTGTRNWGPPDAITATYWMDDPYVLPVEDDTFDIVISSNVFEHVAHIWDWMRELARVVKPGGHVITISPVSWPFHESPLDCWRAHPAGMRALNEFVGLETVLCVSESLEPAPSRRTVPGEGAINLRPWTLTGAVHRLIGWPRQVSIDLLTVARKP